MCRIKYVEIKFRYAEIIVYFIILLFDCGMQNG